MNNKNIVELLINKGADIDTEDKSGHTPLYYAIRKEDKDTVKLLEFLWVKKNLLLKNN